MVREPTSSTEAVARGSSSSMEGGHLIGKVQMFLMQFSVRICSFSLQQFVSSKYVYAVSVLQQFQIDVALFLGYNLCLLVLL